MPQFTASRSFHHTLESIVQGLTTGIQRFSTFHVYSTVQGIGQPYHAINHPSAHRSGPRRIHGRFSWVLLQHWPITLLTRSNGAPYFKGTLNHSRTFRAGLSSGLIGYTDSGFASPMDPRKSAAPSVFPRRPRSTPKQAALHHRAFHI